MILFQLHSLTEFYFSFFPNAEKESLDLERDIRSCTCTILSENEIYAELYLNPMVIDLIYFVKYIRELILSIIKHLYLLYLRS